MASAAAVRRLWTGVTVEPVVACYMTAFTLITLTVSNLNLRKACEVELRLGRDVCDALMASDTTAGGHAAAAAAARTSVEAAVQRSVSGMMLWQTCVQNALPCVLVLFVGEWSDRLRKRVPFMLLPLYGELARNAGQLLCVYYFRELSIEAAGVAESWPLALTGGQTTMTMTVYSYIGDVTSAENRTFRIGIVNSVMALSMVIGTSLSGIVYSKLGFYGAYGISSVLLVTGILYGLIYVKEVTSSSSAEEDGRRLSSIKRKSRKTTVWEICDLKLIVRSFNTTFKKRMDTQRLQIIILLIILMANAGITNGLLFSTIILSKLLKISDEIIGVLSTTSQSLAAILYFFAHNGSIFYLGPPVNVLIAAENLSVKSLMTKLVPKNELGKMAAIFGIAEIVASLVFGLMYTVLYENTISVLPGAFYIITLTFSALSIVLFLWMYKTRKSEFRHTNGELDKVSAQLKSKNTNCSNISKYGTIVKS